jgi:hypothetical protein
MTLLLEIIHGKDEEKEEGRVGWGGGTAVHLNYI